MVLPSAKGNRDSNDNSAYANDLTSERRLYIPQGYTGKATAG